MRTTRWRCPVCGSNRSEMRWPVPSEGTEGGVDADAFRPSSAHFGRPGGSILRCLVCGHGSLDQVPPTSTVRAAYAEAADPISLREEDGQVETARRALADVERIAGVRPPGRLADVGCWTGSLLVAAAERGWSAAGVEPSRWASARAQERGLDVHTAEIDEHRWEAGSIRVATMCDVLEHLEQPRSALAVVHGLLEPGGALLVTVPDAGSLLARVMGRRWWSVLPMHVQYFSRGSMVRLLESCGFEVRSVRTHAKAFSARYYAERLGGYSRAIERAAARVVARGMASRLVAPDFRDRMAVIAVRRNDGRIPEDPEQLDA